MNASGINHANVVVTATSGTGATVSKLYNGLNEVTKGTGSANWSLSNGTVTMKAAYLSTLAVGEYDFRLTFTKDNDCHIALTVENTGA